MKKNSQGQEQPLMCPSSQPDIEDAMILGVVDRSGESPRVSYVSGKQPVTQELLDLANPLKPTDVYRFAGRCETKKCTHFQENECQLAKRIHFGMDEVSLNLPACALRKTCRWYLQEGPDMCMRCPQVTTNVDGSDAKAREIAGIDAFFEAEKEKS